MSTDLAIESTSSEDFLFEMAELFAQAEDQGLARRMREVALELRSATRMLDQVSRESLAASVVLAEASTVVGRFRVVAGGREA